MRKLKFLVAFLIIALIGQSFLADSERFSKGFFNFSAFAQTNHPAMQIRVSKSAAPINFELSDGETDKKIEPSAAAAIGDGTLLLVADDKDDKDKKSLAVVETATGKVMKRLQLPTVEKNPKWEGLAQDGEDFYIIGSHAVNAGDSAEKLKNRSRLFRFRLKNVQNPLKIAIDDRPEVFSELNITESLRALNLYDANPPSNRVKIEGLAFKNEGDKRRLLIGLREPSELISIYSADLGNSKKLELKPYFSFAAGEIDGSEKTATVRFKLSSIEYYPPWSGFFLITSTEDAKNRFHGNILWFVSDETIKNSSSVMTAAKMPVIVPQMIRFFSMNMKAEGFCFLPKTAINKNDSNSISAAILFDNDTEDTFDQLGLLGMMQTIELSNLKK